ncbi:hypothetical protein QBC46DRAFT_386554 [Diplogelasinospora grovesii]|uniref:Transcription factor SipA3 n=1 Tax=Diplogelasinospora grovesii TaxID=303347 RepID=A0AAN6N644_9PEZI|nr:hypothetical protein QBC46DRAFT_386554 [Diplogelasinospora grovesii]
MSEPLSKPPPTAAAAAAAGPAAASASDSVPASQAQTQTQTQTQTTQQQSSQAQQSKPRTGPAIPVSLNEAALDSPTFRAVTAHFAEQMDGIERWLEGYVRQTSKLAHDMLALEDTINSYLSKMTPPMAAPSAATASADTVIDTDYTLLALRRAGDGARDWWNSMLGIVRRLEPISVEPIRAFLNGELKSFKETRRSVETTQKTFDTTLARYVGQSKTKEPSALREDAFSVYETRKAYLKASMDFCQMAPQLRFSLDKLLVRVCADLFRDMRRSRDATGGGAVTAKWGDEMDRIRGWAKEMESSESVFRRELHMARRDVGESTLAAFKPSRELEDYSVSTVPFLGSRGPANNVVQRKGMDQTAVISEKQGWLFLRVLSGKPVRTNWVRRWYYCRDGIFGWLVQGPQGVLQGDEIGVLLCSAKPAVQEERRFCFEVKTKTQTLLLQAETQKQLIEWLEVFEVAKKKAFETTMGRDQSLALPGGVDPAFAITPPSIPEFSAKALESVDELGGSLERAGTLPVPGPDGNLTTRASFDVTVNQPPRRSITTSLQREEGESGRDHAARIMQKLDLHRKGTFATGTDSNSATAPGAGGIASLISASHNLLPGYTVPPGASSQTAPAPSPRLPNPLLITSLEPRPGSLAPTTLVKPPVPTSLSKAAVLASSNSTDASRALSSAAVLANYWGSSPWMSMYSPRPGGAPPTPQPDLDDPFVATVQATARTPSGEGPGTALSLHRKTLSVDAKYTPTISTTDAVRTREKTPAETFPPNYPPELKAQHAQFRLLFPTAPLDEKLVLVFNAAWTSSSEEIRDGQGMAGNGRIYVTPDNMYFYGQQMGLVVAYTISLDIITEVTAAPGRDCDFIFLHLGQDMNDTGFTRITIKIFLEDLPLLHSRLNLLVDDLQAEEPMELSEIITALINMEKEQYEKRSPSVESWEEISSNTPIDDGTHHGRAPVSRRLQDLSSRYNSHSRSLRGKRHAKFQLPAHSVVYEPEDIGKAVAERHFEISAKACFHVLFGDKSFIFPKLYFERRAKEIAQGPWELQDHGTMKRQFRFKVDAVDMLGRSKSGDVTDSQAIDIFNDHITYVVTHTKTPWHLPHSHAFKLITKVVITHVAKSKCKLAIFTRVDWSSARSAPVLAFAKSMVQRQALDDAAKDAEELAEVATDQVRKLGPHSRTKRAIQVYGHIGQQTQVVVFSPAGTAGDGTASKKLIRPRTLTAMVLETCRSFMESAITSVMLWAFAGIKKIFSIITANRVILVLLAVSATYNLVVTSQNSSTWWTERKAAKYMSRLGVGPNPMMSKAIYLADLEEVAQTSAAASWTSSRRPANSQCYDTFQAVVVNTTDMDAPYQDAGISSLGGSSKAAARRIRRTRQRLGAYRHDLLVAMRVVNGIELEMVQSEWENWLADENARCDQVRSILLLGDGTTKAGEQSSGGEEKLKGQDHGHERSEGQKVVRGDKESLRKWHDEYCGSCRADQQMILADRKPW